MKRDASPAEIRQIRILAAALTVLVIVLTVGRYALRGLPEGIPIGLILVGVMAVILLISIFRPTILSPGYRVWMVVARAIGWFNARVLLCILFFVMFTPIAFVMRLLGHRTPRRSFESDQPSFWVEKEATGDGKERYTRQF